MREQKCCGDCDKCKRCCGIKEEIKDKTENEAQRVKRMFKKKKKI